MYYLIGNKKEFAVELDVSPNKWSNKTALWLNGNRLGNWNDHNLLAPFIRSIYRIAINHKNLWSDKLLGLNCNEAFLMLNPFYIDPERFYDLDEETQKQYLWLDNFLFNFGENFNSWNINVVSIKGKCRFIWLYNHNLKNRASNIDALECFDVPLPTLQNVYNEMKKIIPGEFWPDSTTKS